MLSALRLGSFKAFGPIQRLPIRPITLVFGPNSAGKSSLIHGLTLVHEALREGSFDVHRTQIGGSSVDLGGFDQYVFRRNLESSVQWTVELDLAGVRGRLADLLAAARSLAVTLTVGRPLDDHGHALAGQPPRVRRYELEADGGALLTLSRRGDVFRFDRLDTGHPVIQQVLRAILELGTTLTSASEADQGTLAETIDALLPSLSTTPTTTLPRRVGGIGEREGTAFEVASLVPVSRGARADDLAEAARLFVPRVLDELLREVYTAVEGQLARLRYLGPLRSFPPRHLAFSQYDDLNWYAGGGHAWDVVRRDETVRSAVNTWLGAPERMQTPYRLRVRQLVAEEQLERPIFEALDKLEQDSFMIMDEAPPYDPIRDKRYEGDGPFADLADIETEAARIRARVEASDIDRIADLVLLDERTGTIVTHRDVGIGVSQVLPVLVSAYANTGQLIAIEQPEIHLHPGLQAELGDVFIESALTRGNTFLLETHSEHLILRVMRRLRETHAGALPDGHPKLLPEHVAVLYVEPTKSGSLVREMPLNERGELVKAWPGGFFEEGLRELL